MTKEIMDAIEKSLPSMQMEVLRKDLEKASKYDAVLSENSVLREKNNRLEIDLSSVRSKIAKAETEISDAADVKRKFEIEKLKYELESQKCISREIRELAMAAFRNPTVIKSFSRQVAVPSGGYAHCASESETQSVE
ncbi:MAG: hypothetical protein IPJ84_18990 [Bdellovibrionales bacterium]|nr:hypothetical protein [Bdellovibrionales bacterium]